MTGISGPETEGLEAPEEVVGEMHKAQMVAATEVVGAEEEVPAEVVEGTHLETAAMEIA